jgi:hypothetical protein
LTNRHGYTAATISSSPQWASGQQVYEAAQAAQVWHAAYKIFTARIPCYIRCLILNQIMAPIPEEAVFTWYHSLFSRRVDLIGDYAGNELFLIEFDSLLLYCFLDPRINFRGESKMFTQPCRSWIAP